MRQNFSSELFEKIELNFQLSLTLQSSNISPVHEMKWIKLQMSSLSQPLENKLADETNYDVFQNNFWSRLDSFLIYEKPLIGKQIILSISRFQKT